MLRLTWRELETWLQMERVRQFSTLPERGWGCKSPGLLDVSFGEALLVTFRSLSLIHAHILP